MNTHPALKLAGIILLALGSTQLIPLAVALSLGEPQWGGFALSAGCTTATGALLFLLAFRSPELRERDGFAGATLSITAAVCAGALPYLFTGEIPQFSDAIFESMSGFTTTGASILVDYAGMSQSVMLWRSMTQWLGGLGILVFAVVVLPALGVGGMQVYKREVPGSYSENFSTRLRRVAYALWLVYVILTVAEFLVLYALGLPPLEALNYALTTICTGGFSTRASSVGGLSSPAIEWALIVFMMLAGMNFSLHYRCLLRRGQKTAHLRDLEWQWYLVIAVLAAFSLTVYLATVQGREWGQALTKSTFQAVSILTTTGYHSDDYTAWGAFPQLLLLLGMLVGGCTGSTTGGVKLARVILVFKYIRQEMLRLVHPRAVIQVRLGRLRVGGEIIENIQAYFFLYLITLAVVTLLIALDGHDMLTSLGVGVSALSNIGPGLGETGPGDGFAQLSVYSKWVMIIAMMLGRLELMTVFVLFTPGAWRR